MYSFSSYLFWKCCFYFVAVAFWFCLSFSRLSINHFNPMLCSMCVRVFLIRFYIWYHQNVKIFLPISKASFSCCFFLKRLILSTGRGKRQRKNKKMAFIILLTKSIRLGHITILMPQNDPNYGRNWKLLKISRNSWRLETCSWEFKLFSDRLNLKFCQFFFVSVFCE